MLRDWWYWILVGWQHEYVAIEKKNSLEYRDMQDQWTAVLGAATKSRTWSWVELTGRWKWHLSEGFSCKLRAPCPVFSILLVKWSELHSLPYITLSPPDASQPRRWLGRSHFLEWAGCVQNGKATLKKKNMTAWSWSGANSLWWSLKQMHKRSGGWMLVIFWSITKKSLFFFNFIFHISVFTIRRRPRKQTVPSWRKRPAS